jgi:glycosyltransferase involved in cell wall biosynthesis
VKKNVYRFLHDLKIFSLMKKDRYDLVVVRDRFISATMALIAAKMLSVKFVYWLSFPFPEYYLYQAEEGIAAYPGVYRLRSCLLRVLLYRLILHSAEHVFVQTPKMLENIAEHGIDKKKMSSVLMGVSVEDIPFFGYETVDRKHDGKTIVYLGTLGKARRMDFLLRAFGKVVAKERMAHLYLVGGGDEDGDELLLKEEAASMGIEDKVHITGFLPQTMAWDHLRDAAVCVSPITPSPILDCGSPTKLVEYMAMGKASVANDHPEQRLVLRESGAGICVPYEEEAFAQAILYLLEHRGESEAMGIRGREYVRRKRNYDTLADIVEQKLLSLRQDETQRKYPCQPARNSVS